LIPKDFITEWRREAPWIEDAQVEQDLVISRALVEIFSNDILKGALAFALKSKLQPVRCLTLIGTEGTGKRATGGRYHDSPARRARPVGG